jgi:RimJ/RimL family protein N-acetyltransferase
MLGPVLRGDRISLEPAQPDQLPIFIRWLNDPEVNRYLPVRYSFTLEQEQQWYESTSKASDDVHWVIIAGDTPIGGTDLRAIDWVDRTASHGLMIGERSEWGKGYATEAVLLRARYAFETLNLERLETTSFAENTAMHRALQKCGYTKVGVRHSAHFRHGTRHDSYLFELLRADWQAA